ncbi:MAG: Vi polysaccharide biosynthesis UDP-N-acetylglucosamine C-6 dehydrogenase TviB, partial [Psychromonas sp.]|nr:Vi polysaccharide biosynthesis UDP-N-acetylglucosamine C-6 dehydrogenase TviB [Psychromonas sp.]
AEAIGYHPRMILAGRRVNDGMGGYIAGQLVKAVIKKQIQVGGARVLIMGLAFKENCPDLRNTRVIDIIAELKEYEMSVEVFDPWVDEDAAAREYGIDLIREPETDTFDAIIMAVAHTQFQVLGASAIRSLGKANHVIYDLKYVLNKDESDIRL